MELGTKIIWTAVVFIIVGAIIGVSGSDGDKESNNMMKVGAVIFIVACAGLILGILVNIWS